MKIRYEQIDAFDGKAKEKLAAKLFSFLKKDMPQWCKERDDNEIKHFIEDMIIFSSNSNIYKEANIQKLILSYIEYNFNLSLAGYNKEQLTNKNFNEEYRLENFISSLMSKKELMKISLDTDLNELATNKKQYISSLP